MPVAGGESAIRGVPEQFSIGRIAPPELAFVPAIIDQYPLPG
jgi:hypothetical protein